MECWPRYADPTDSTAQQYPGWPVTISMFDNYGRKAVAWLPLLKFSGATSPVVQVVDEHSGEVVYTVRANGDSFQAKVFKQGYYTLNVGEPGTERMKTLYRVASQPTQEGEAITVQF